MVCDSACIATGSRIVVSREAWREPFDERTIRIASLVRFSSIPPGVSCIVCLFAFFSTFRFLRKCVSGLSKQFLEFETVCRLLVQVACLLELGRRRGKPA